MARAISLDHRGPFQWTTGQHESGDARDVDDPSAPLLDERSFDRLDEIEGAFQIRIQHEIPVGFAHSHRKSVARKPSVIDQNIDARKRR